MAFTPRGGRGGDRGGRGGFGGGRGGDRGGRGGFARGGGRDRGGRGGRGGGARGGRGAPRGGRGAPRGGRGGGAKGGAKTIVEPHRHEGIFVARGKEDMLVTKNLSPGESVYGEKRISVESAGPANEDGTPGTTKVEYRVWNPFRSKLAAGVLGGMDEIFIKPGAKVLYLEAVFAREVQKLRDERIKPLEQLTLEPFERDHCIVSGRYVRSM
ncbi:hypothetical protein CJF31_00010926 [Rutstroemia sp. NJR-2017a BVV2]|nr:hypothetical protein CJF31_00010926 [Rutstroemia sp. NJR-2017a BVV2]